MVATGSWVDHSFDIGMLSDANSVSFCMILVITNIIFLNGFILIFLVFVDCLIFTGFV